MRPDAIELDETPSPGSAPRTLSSLDRDSVLLALTGGSVVDWTGLSFRNLDEVDRFLALWQLDVKNEPWARERLVYVYNQAVNYLEEHVGLTFKPDIRRPNDVREAFLRASSRERFSRTRIQVCAILKLMHVINHLEMQQLKAEAAFREIDLIDLASDRVVAAAERMRAEGLPIVAFYGNRKTRPSVITKLLAKREATAATVFDKLRFRVVTETRADIPTALAWLLRNLVPFPCVIPGESHQNLLTDEEIAAFSSHAPELRNILRPAGGSANTASGASYRVVNFIADLPVRVYDLPGTSVPRNRVLLGEAVSVMVELQLVDAVTARTNEIGENNHALYKERQMARVLARLGRSSGKDSA
jgi:uncharacterized protein (TIGR04552 family)